MKRLKLAWHILRGHSVMYRVRFDEPVTIVQNPVRTWITDCTFRGRGKQMALTFVGKAQPQGDGPLEDNGRVVFESDPGPTTFKKGGSSWDGSQTT